VRMGGGVFNAQSAHPFETPTAASNLLAMLLIGLLGAALTNGFGRMVGDQRQGSALLMAMLVLLAVGTVMIYAAEAGPNHALAASGLTQARGNLEGKEVRFGIPGSALFSELATATSSGAVNSMLDSYAPLSVLALLANMMVSEVIIGGPGSGLFSILLFALLAVFLGGMMIGRTPEYLGKKIEAREVKLAMLAILAPAAALLGLTALACVLPSGVSALGNDGARGFSEMFYAYTSAANTNGSALAGLSSNTPFWNLTLALAMVVGRFLVIVPVLAIAGALAGKHRIPIGGGTLPTTGMVWIGLLVGVIVVVGGLTYLPAAVLGPVAEYLS
jgi:K+-transporting ATPase ATPase A chain